MGTIMEIYMEIYMEIEVCGPRAILSDSFCSVLSDFHYCMLQFFDSGSVCQYQGS